MIALLESAATSEAAAETESTSSPRAPDALLWVGLAGVLLLAAAAWPMQKQRLPAWAIAALSTGLAAWAVVAWKAAGLPEGLAPIAREPISAARVASGVALSLALAAVCCIRTADQQFDLVGVIAWWGAIAVWLWGWRPARCGGRAGPRDPSAVSRRWLGVGAALLLILALGAFFRFHHLSEIPPHPGSDHAEDLMNLMDLQAGDRPVFFPRNTGQAPLPFYFEYLLHRVLGLPINFLTLKISTAAIGMLAILAMYRLGAELGGTRLGLVAAAIMAFSKWPTFGARRGLTFVWAVFPAALALAALLRCLRRGDRGSALSAGFWIGLGQFGYNAFKIVPALVPIAVGLALFDPRWKGRRAKLLGGALLITATSLLVFLPLLQYMLQKPQDFWYRAMTRAGSLERPLPGPAPVIFASNLKNMMLAFHWRGDEAWINTVSSGAVPGPRDRRFPPRRRRRRPRVRAARLAALGARAPLPPGSDPRLDARARLPGRESGHQPRRGGDAVGLRSRGPSGRLDARRGGAPDASSRASPSSSRFSSSRPPPSARTIRATSSASGTSRRSSSSRPWTWCG